MTRLASWADFGTHDESAYPELWRGCVGAWAPCLGPTGTRLHDLSVYRNWGTLTNMVPADDWVVSGRRYALDFDGTNDLIELGDLNLLRQPLSISAWALRRSSGANHTIIDGATDSSNSFGAHLRFTTGDKIRWYFNNANLSAVDTLTTPTLNVWHHVVGTYDGTTARIYLNGILENQRTGDAFGTAIGNYRIGCLSSVYGANAGVMNGLLDDVRIYDRTLNASEIRTLYLRRGIAYEMHRPTYYAPQVTSARRRKILTGQV